LVKEALTQRKNNEKNGTNDPTNKYHKVRMHYKKLTRDKKSAYYDKIKETINSTKNPSEFWNAMKVIRPKQTITNPVPVRKWITFYDDIMPSKSNYAPYEGTFHEDIDKEIDMEELQCALVKSKPGKAAGPDGISAEFFRNLSTGRKLQLLDLFNSILRNEILPEDWSTSKTVMLYKKGDPLEPINYRPITLLNAAMKVFMRIITSRLSSWASKQNILPEEQAEFQTKRGCDEQIFNVHAAIQIGTRKKQKIYALFIDFKRTFPSVPHDKLWSKLHTIGVSAKIIRILQSLYQVGNTRIRLDEGMSEPIPITEGLMQGYVASPLLFTVYISDIINTISKSGISGIEIDELYT
jgi:hypothetical protein